MKKKLLCLGLACALALSPTVMSYAAQETTNSITMESCGAFLFEWRPVDCGDGHYFAIIVGGNTLYESDVILMRGYDYAYTFNPSYGRTWGEVPSLANVDGVWAIPENQPNLPEGTQPTLRITLMTNNRNLPTKERYIDVVSLPAGVRTSELPNEVRKYLINVDGSDAGAYDGTETAGWDESDNVFRYRKPDGTYVTNSWLSVDEKEYYMDENGIMLTDTVTPDGVYVNAKGERTRYLPGWTEVDGEKRYILKNGYYAANCWVEDAGKHYYFNMACHLLTNTTTPDGYYVGEDGAWDGNPSTLSTENPNLGPGGDAYAAETAAAAAEGWEADGEFWKYRLADGSHVTNNWKQTDDGKWYYFDESSRMVTDTTTPDGHRVGSDGVWIEPTSAE